MIVHYSNVIMSPMTSQITKLTVVCSNIYSGADERKHQSSASLVFVRGIHGWPVNFPHKGPVKLFHLMLSSWAKAIYSDRNTRHPVANKMSVKPAPLCEWMACIRAEYCINGSIRRKCCSYLCGPFLVTIPDNDRSGGKSTGSWGWCRTMLSSYTSVPLIVEMTSWLTIQENRQQWKHTVSYQKCFFVTRNINSP